jgi:hypothetical protein
MSLSHSPSIVTNGLVLCLDAANTKSYPGTGATWTDLSGNENNVTLVNSPTFSTTNSGRITFNGSTQYGTTPSSTSLTFSQPTVTIACTTAAGTAIAKGRYGSYWNYGIVAPGATSFKARNNNNDVESSTYPAVSGVNIFTAAWDGAFVNFYLNGKYLSQTNSSYSPVANNLHNLTIGVAGSGGSFTEYYGGSISYILVHNRCLSANEINQNFNALRGRYGL